MVDEQKKTEGNTKGDTGEGDKQTTDSIVERADAAAERLAKENEKMEANIRRQEEIMAKQALGGKSDGANPEQKKPMTDVEYKDYFLKHGKPPEGQE